MFRMFIDNLLFLLPIIGLSVYSLALVTNKFRWLMENTLRESQYQILFQHLQRGEIREGYDLLNNPTIEKKLMTKAVNIIQRRVRTDLQKDLTLKARQELTPFASDLSTLASLANLATLMGLLGTVVGMIIAFYRLNVSGQSDPYVLAGGISKALITTAAGLIIAIPLMFAQNYFQRAARIKEGNLQQLIAFFHQMQVEKRII